MPKIKAEIDFSVSWAQKPEFHSPASSSIDNILFFQKTIDNQEIKRLYKSEESLSKLKISQPGSKYEQ